MNQPSRRQVLKGAAAAVPASWFWATEGHAAHHPAKKEMIPLAGAFCHHVYFWLKNPESGTDRERFFNNLTTFLEQVDVIQSVQVGEPAGTPRDVVDGSFDFDLVVTFKDAADQDAYQVHPAHQQFVDDTADLWTKVIVYDSIRTWPK